MLLVEAQNPNNLGQIEGKFSQYYSMVKASGGGTGSSGNFNSLTSTDNYPGFSKYFLFDGSPPRLLRTKDISALLSKTNTISFYYIVGNFDGNNGGNSPELNDDLSLEFLNATGEPINNCSYTIWSGGTTYTKGSNFTPFQHILTADDKNSCLCKMDTNCQQLYGRSLCDK